MAEAAVPASASALEQALTMVLRHPVLFVAVLLYAIWYRLSLPLIKSPKAWGPRWLAVRAARFFSWLMGAIGCKLRLLKLPEEPCEGKQFVVTWHPHGAYTTMAFMHCGVQTATSTPLTWFPGIAPFLFNMPGFREALLLLNARSVDGKTLEALAASGHSIGVQPGGIAEQLQSDERREIAVFHQRLGFIRLAIRHGLPLLPVYIFGENQAYDSSTLSSLTSLVHRTTGVPFIFVLGRWGLPWIVPRRVDVSVCWGRAVPTGPQSASPSEEQVERVFERYVVELRRLFDEHKDACLPPQVAARGLTVRVHGKSKK